MLQVSAIGSNLGSLFKDGAPHLLLVGCGAAGAVAGILRLRLRDLCLRWSADDRFDHVLTASVADFGGDGGNCFLYRDGYGKQCLSSSDQAF